MKRIILFMVLFAVIALLGGQVQAKDAGDKILTCPPGEVMRGIDTKNGIILCTTDCATDLDGDAVSDCMDWCIDADSDDYGEGISCLGPDCNDQDGSINPASAEICNDLDDNCDGSVDEGDDSILCPPGPHVDTTICNDPGECAIVTCETGYSDSDGIYETGCEMRACPCIFPEMTGEFICDYQNADIDGAQIVRSDPWLSVAAWYEWNTNDGYCLVVINEQESMETDLTTVQVEACVTKIKDEVDTRGLTCFGDYPDFEQ